MDLRGWHVIDNERAVLWREYNFSKTATATTMVFRGTDGFNYVVKGNSWQDGFSRITADVRRVFAITVLGRSHGSTIASSRPIDTARDFAMGHRGSALFGN